MKLMENYSNSNSYLIDLLKILDLRIERYILQENLREEKALNPLKGLTISKDEVDRIFKNDFNIENSLNMQRIEEKLNSLYLEIDNKSNLSYKKGIVLNFQTISEIFNLDYIERNILLIGLSVELDSKYEKLYSFINDSVDKKRPTIDLVFKLLNIPFQEKLNFRNKFALSSFLKKFVLKPKSFNEESTMFSNEIIIDERIIGYILGDKNLDSDLNNIACVYEVDFCFEKAEYKEEIFDSIKLSINNFIDDDSKYKNNLFLYICGDRGIGKKYLVRSYANSIGKNLITVDLKTLIIQETDFKELILKVMRESLLKDCVVCFHNFEYIETEMDRKEIHLKEFFKVMNWFNQPIFITSINKYKNNQYFSDNSTVVFSVDRPTYEEKLNIWNFNCDKYSVNLDNAADLASKFNFTPLQIENSIRSIKSKELLNLNSEKNIYESCYEQVDNKLTEKAVKVKAAYTWGQLVLPKEQKKLLEDACNQAKNRHIVYEKWGFSKKLPYGKGLSIICAGPPGTGKTMSAQVIANELNLELYRIDLSQVVSKYVGETEKNLHQIFKEASLSNAILFFDEADSLFGKRSDVKSANDRYANIETSYLLQKIEEYEGISMMATNFINNIDKAFLRRINYIVNYPFPDSESRKKIWEVMFTCDVPLEEEIDFEYLSKNFEIAGGNIKNVVVYSAFLAANNKEKISMKHILKAVKYELQKMDKLLLLEDFGQYKYLLK